MPRPIPQLSLPRKKSLAPDLDGRPTRDALNVVGLFAGIGGIEEGLRRSGHEARLLSEIDPAANAVLDEHFDVEKRNLNVCDLLSLPRGTDLISAGFPCQDLSQAGRTAGIEGPRSALVGEVFRLLDGKGPRVKWVLLENVPFMMQLGRGRALQVILSELERRGFMWAYRVVNSRAFGLPQRRERLYFLASRYHDPRSVLFVDEVQEPADNRSFRDVACGFYWTEGLRGLGWAVDAVPTLKGGSTIGIPSPPAIMFPSGSICKPDIRDVERMQGFEAEWTLPAEAVSKRGNRWKLVGNAVTVRTAQWIGKRLRNPGEYDATGDVPLPAKASWPNAAWSMGDGRFAADLSKWPVHVPATPLQSFLRYPLVDLSERATEGFLSRARQARLRFPDGFLKAVENHLHQMRGRNLRAII